MDNQFWPNGVWLDTDCQFTSVIELKFSHETESVMKISNKNIH